MATLKKWLKRLAGYLMATLKEWLKRLAGYLMPTDTQTPAPAQAPTQTPNTTERHKVAGISYRTAELIALGTSNSDFDLNKREMIEEGLIEERVYEWDFYPSTCELKPEPDNPEDPNAIKVEVDGTHIGYIKKGSCAHIHKLLREGRIESVSCEIGGGRYKILLTEYTEEGNERYTLERTNIPFYAVVSIKRKEEPNRTK